MCHTAVRRSLLWRRCRLPKRSVTRLVNYRHFILIPYVLGHIWFESLKQSCQKYSEWWTELRSDIQRSKMDATFNFGAFYERLFIYFCFVRTIDMVSLNISNMLRLFACRNNPNVLLPDVYSCNDDDVIFAKRRETWHAFVWELL